MNKRYTYSFRDFINIYSSNNQVENLKETKTIEVIVDIKIIDLKMQRSINDIREIFNSVLVDFSDKNNYVDEKLSIETLTDCLFSLLSNKLSNIGCSLIKINVGESPVNFYSIMLD